MKTRPTENQYLAILNNNWESPYTGCHQCCLVLCFLENLWGQFFPIKGFWKNLWNKVVNLKKIIPEPSVKVSVHFSNIDNSWVVRFMGSGSGLGLGLCLGK